MEVAKIGSVHGGREEVLLHVRRTHAAPWADVQRPTMSGAAFVDDGAFDPLVEGADDGGEASGGNGNKAAYGARPSNER
jgi:hypothetical protein